MTPTTTQQQEAEVTALPAPVLEVKDLHVRFEQAGGDPVTVLHGIDLAVHAGQRLGLVGESGSGKSTVSLTCMGLLPANATAAGQVFLNGTDILAGGERSIRPHRWKDIAMVFQGAMAAFNPVRTIGKQIAEPMLLHHTQPHRKAARAHTEHLLDLVGLTPAVADRYPHELSGGMRQRAVIAMALACEPKVLLADEPTTALDVIVQAQIADLLVDLTDRLGLGLILVSHDLPLVSQYCEHLAVMRNGQVVEHGPSARLRTDPAHPYTRQLFDASEEAAR
ncbi:ABC transporter ATP-binding protein [Streptomyces sp. NPDC059271]|uniref:ABC transporter ATP-binding protein n=1 Tax=Streptomyces sp. NPDC059271 TaxID=3346799 RepID=UPI00368BEC03